MILSILLITLGVTVGIITYCLCINNGRISREEEKRGIK